MNIVRPTLYATAAVLAVGLSSAGATNDIKVCHHEGNGSFHTISVANPSVLAAHLRHGDFLGNCPTPTATATATPSATPVVTATPSVTATATPSATPSVTATPSATPVSDADPCADVINKPTLRPENWETLSITLRDPDCGQFYSLPVHVPPSTVIPSGVELAPPVIINEAPTPQNPIVLPPMLKLPNTGS